MPSGPRQLLEHRFAEISTDLESLFETALGQARRDQTEQLNQAVRRLRIAPDADELCATLSGAASRFAAGAIVFRLTDGDAASDTITIPLSDAPALAAAAQSQDPLIVAATPGEVSAALVEQHAGESRAAIFPVQDATGGAALVYCWGDVQAPAVELLAQVASAVWAAYPPPPEPEPPASELVSIALAPPSPQGASQSAESAAGNGKSDSAGTPKPLVWEDLMSDEQQIHLRAQRAARVKTAGIRLYHPELVRAGRLRGNLYDALRVQIDDARQSFREQFFDTCPSMVDYLHLEITRTLANDDPDLLGSNYPGPLV